MVGCQEILSVDTAALLKLASDYNVNPLAIEDCSHRDQRPKLDDYGNHQLLVWFLVAEGKIYEIQFLIFEGHLVIVPHDVPPSGGTWLSYLRITNQHKDVWHLLYEILDRATDQTWNELKILFDQVDEFEQEIFLKDPSPQALLNLKKQLNQIDFSVGHLSSVAQQLQNLCNPSGGDLGWKFRDLHDHCERIDRRITLYRGQIATTIELLWGVQSNRTNMQIKRLSLLASISVPLTFWSSFWGMNFQAIPFHSPVLFVVAISIMILSVALTFWLLLRKGYWSDGAS